MLVRGHGCPLDRVLDELVHVEWLEVEVDLACFEPVEVQHLGDHPVQPLSVGVDLAGDGFDLAHLHVLVADQLAEALNPDERGAELVAHHRDELALQAAQLLELRQVGHRSLLGLPFGGHVFECGQEVVDGAAGLPDGRDAEMDPEGAALGTPRLAVGLIRVRRRRRGLERLEDARDVLDRQERVRRRADEGRRRRAEHGCQSRIGIRDAPVGCDGGDALRGVVDDVVQHAFAVPEPCLDAPSLAKLPHRPGQRQRETEHPGGAQRRGDQDVDVHQRRSGRYTAPSTTIRDGVITARNPAASWSLDATSTSKPAVSHSSWAACLWSASWNTSKTQGGISRSGSEIVSDETIAAATYATSSRLTSSFNRPRSTGLVMKLSIPPPASASLVSSERSPVRAITLIGCSTWR